MHPTLALGKIVTAPNLAEAKYMVDHRKDDDISAVIFEHGLVLPKWTEKDKADLTRTFTFFKDNVQRDRFLAQQILSLADEFNICMAHRNIIFTKDDLSHTPPHFHEEAIDGWMEFNFCGQGTSYANPQCSEASQIGLTTSGDIKINLAELRKLATQGKIEFVELKAGQAIFLDERAVQRQRTQQGFSGLLYGRN